MTSDERDQGRRRAFVIGAGLAGLAAALRLGDEGWQVTVFEASPHVGGRCRSYVDPELGLLDNGTHALTAANPVALAMLRRANVRERWLGPPDGVLRIVDLEERRVIGLRARIGDFARLGLRLRHALKLMGPDRPISTVFSPADPVFHRLIEPLTLAALNTPPEEASSRLLRRLFLETWRGPGALIPLVAERGVGPDLIDPLAGEIRARGGMVRTSARVRRLRFEDGRIGGLDLGEESLPVDVRTSVILAVPPADAERLTGLQFGLSYSAIVNAHFEVDSPVTERACMLGVLGGATQWVLLRGSILSVTVSAADGLVDEPSDAIADRLWSEVRATLEVAGYAAPKRLRHRIVKERRATIRQPAGLVRPQQKTAFQNLVLAGDWTDTSLPATIEGALRSGLRAARIASRSVV